MYEVELKLQCRKGGNIKQHFIKWRRFTNVVILKIHGNPPTTYQIILIQHFHVQGQSKNERKVH